MDSVSAQFAKAFIACEASHRSIKRVYRTLALMHHPDKGGTQVDFQKLEHIYEIAQKGRSGMTQLRRSLPKKVSLKAPVTAAHADKLGVFVRDAEMVNNKPLYVNEGGQQTAIWWPRKVRARGGAEGGAVGVEQRALAARRRDVHRAQEAEVLLDLTGGDWRREHGGVLHHHRRSNRLRPRDDAAESLSACFDTRL